MVLSLCKASVFAALVLLSLGSGPSSTLAATIPAASPASKRQQSVPGSLDAGAIAAQRFGGDAPWYQDRIPLFECSDSLLNDVYYYRWSLLRAHQRDLGSRGYITTEFLDDVSWQLEPFASLNDATGHHVGEARWLRDRRFADDYLAFMYTGGNDRHFSDHMADTAYRKFLVDGDAAFLATHLDAMVRLYNQWDDHRDASKGLYWIEPLQDATEYTISSIDASGGQDGFRGGEAFRPSINSYMYANARAIARISAQAGNAAQADDFDARAEAIKAKVQAELWNSTLSHFIDRHYQQTDFVQYYQPIRGRELVGFLPWMFDLPDDNATYSAAWQHLLSTQELKGERGLRTVEPSYEYYMRQYRYEGDRPECQWNGPVWPYQTTQVLLGLANVLDHYDQPHVSKADHLALLREYAQLHVNPSTRQLNLEEDYYPDTGLPVVGLGRSNHYFHSGFVDLILSGLVGIRPQPDDTLVVHPMVDASLGWFRADRIRYHDHDLSVVWDADGSRYDQGAGLRIYLDGRLAAQSATLQRQTVSLSGGAAGEAPTFAHPTAQTIQLVRDQHPLPSASSNTDAEQLHEVLDGRTWFFAEPYHGWTSSSDAAEHWFAIELDAPTTLSRAELAFFSDGNAVDVPTGYRMERSEDGSQWTEIATTQKADPVRNGITQVAWDETAMTRLRVVMQQARGKSVRLVEFKAF